MKFDLRQFYGLIKREILQLFSFKPLIVAEGIQPIIWIALFVASMAGTVSQIEYRGTHVSYFVFALPGLIVMQSFNQIGFSLSRVSDERRHGMFKILLTSGVSHWEYILSKIGVSILISLTQICLLLLFSHAIAGNIFTASRAYYLLALILTALSTMFWSGMGITLGLLFSSAESSSLAKTVILLPVIFSSSIFYDISRAPLLIALLGTVNPLTYVVVTVRSLFFGVLEESHIFALIASLTLMSLVVCYWTISRVDLLVTQR